MYLKWTLKCTQQNFLILLHLHPPNGNFHIVLSLTHSQDVPYPNFTIIFLCYWEKETKDKKHSVPIPSADLAPPCTCSLVFMAISVHAFIFFFFMHSQRCFHFQKLTLSTYSLDFITYHLLKKVIYHFFLLACKSILNLITSYHSMLKLLSSSYLTKSKLLSSSSSFNSSYLAQVQFCLPKYIPPPKC